DRSGRAARLFDRGLEPDLARAAAHLVGLVARRIRQRRERAPELDHVAIAIVPLIENREILKDLVNRHCGAGALGGGAIRPHLLLDISLVAAATRKRAARAYEAEPSFGRAPRASMRSAIGAAPCARKPAATPARSASGRFWLTFHLP